MKYIKIKVHPDSKENKIIRKKEDTFEIWTKQAPENNRANLAVLSMLSKELNIDINKFLIIKGQHSPSKIIQIR